MERTQKVVVTPLESESTPPSLPLATDPYTQFTSSQTNTPHVRKTKSHPILEKWIKAAKIFAKLARIEGYDENFRIKNENGQYIENSNMIDLLSNALVPSKMLLGQEAFVSLLHRAGVEPDLIANENIRGRLVRLYETQGKQVVKEPQIYTTVAPPSAIRVPVITSRKRKRNDEDETPPALFEEQIEPPSKRVNWEIPEGADQELPDGDTTEF